MQRHPGVDVNADSCRLLTGADGGKAALLNRAAPWVVALIAIAAAGSAHSAQPVASETVRPRADPNQKICQDLVAIGSRIAKKRFCATRAEWEAKKKDDRDTVDSIQRNQCVLGLTGMCGH